MTSAQTLWVGSRKGLFVAQRDNTGWRIGKPHFPGEPVSQLAASPHDGACYAALRLGHFGVKLWKSVDGGSEWQEIAAPAFPPTPTEGPWNDDETPWTGDQVWAQYRAGNIEGIRSYCETDVLNTYLVYLRFELFRGRLSAEEHAAEIARIRDFLSTQGKPHLSEFLAAWPI